MIEDYFTSPDNAEDDDDEEDDSEDNSCMPGSAHSLEGAVMQINCWVVPACPVLSRVPLVHDQS